MKTLTEGPHLSLYNNSWKFLEKLVKLKTSYSLQTAKKVIMRKTGFFSKKEQHLKYQSFF